MTDPFGFSTPGMDAMRDFLTSREPDIYEAKARLRRVLVDNRGRWITEEGLAQRAKLTARATSATLEVMRTGGVVRRGTTRAGNTVWRIS